MRRRILIALAGLTALALVVALAGRAPPPSSGAAASRAVHFAGCVEVRVGPTCATADGPLRLWVPGATPPRLTVDGAQVDAAPAATPGGHRVALTVPAGATTLDVTTTDGRWRLALAPAPQPISLAAGAASIDARVEGAVGGQRARLLRASGRLALRRGELDRAIATLAEAQAAALAAGLDSEARLAAATRSHVFFMQRRIADARAALVDLPEPAPGDAHGAYVVRFAGAAIARGAGDLRAAVGLLSEAAAIAERVGLATEARAARHEQGTLLGDLGRVDASAQVLERVRASLPDDVGPCERGDVLTNLAWASIRGRRPAPAIGHLDRALRLYDGCDRSADFRRSIARVNLAVAHLEADAPAAAAEALAGADEAGGPEVAAWRMIVEGRLARRRGDLAAAREIFAELERRAVAFDSTALRWRAGLEQGLTAEAACDWAAAAAAYRQSEALLFDASLQIAADAGRTRFLADRAASAAHLVRALVALEQPAQAFDAARRARRRGLLGFSQQARLAGMPAARRASWEATYADYVAERATFEAAAAGDWDRTAAELAAATLQRRAQRQRLSALLDEMATLAGRAPVEATLPPFSVHAPALGWFPAPRAPSACAATEPATWYGFAAIDGAVRAAPMQAVDDPLAPFAAELSSALGTATRLELLPAGSLRDRDLHLLPLDGESLSARLPVVWRLDGPRGAPDAAAVPSALVVSDPRVDLTRARQEGHAVAGRLGDAGWSVQRLEGTAVTGAALRAGLADTTLFHYAGHAVAEGLDGWQSAFLLAEGTLSVGELLTLPAAPRWAVLAACESGRAPGDVSGIGLAHALLSVGTRAVVATARPVADEDGARFSEAFYGALLADSSGEASVFDAYRRGLAALRPEARGAFRLLVP